MLPNLKHLRKIISSLWFMGLSTLLAFPLLAWPVLYFTDRTFLSIFAIAHNQIFSIPLYLSAGILFGLFIIWLSELAFFEKALSDYKSILNNYKITRWNAFYLSVCAGVGEEIFFRGALQPLFGIWFTAIFFVAIHGYYSYKVWRKTVFGLLLTFFIALIGWAAREYSLWHAIAAHFSYDFVLLMYIRYTKD